MRFYPVVLSLLSVCIGSSTALWISSDTPDVPQNPNTIQNEPQPYSHDTQCVLAGNLEYNVTAAPIRDNIVVTWLRDAFDNTAAYRVVQGQPTPYNRDHFIELQSVRNALLKYPAWKSGTMSVNDLYTLAVFVNQNNNIFNIGNTLNSAKSRINLADYTKPGEISRYYLCQHFVGGNETDLVANVVHDFVTAMSGHANAVVKHVGKEVTTLLNLNRLSCK